MSSPFHPITPRAGSVTALALKVSVWVLGAALTMGAQAQTTASGADVSVEAPLMGGGLGRAQETQAMGNGAAAGALANGLNGAGLQGLGARMAGQPAQVGACLLYTSDAADE